MTDARPLWCVMLPVRYTPHVGSGAPGGPHTQRLVPKAGVQSTAPATSDAPSGPEKADQNDGGHSASIAQVTGKPANPAVGLSMWGDASQPTGVRLLGPAFETASINTAFQPTTGSKINSWESEADVHPAHETPGEASAGRPSCPRARLCRGPHPLFIFPSYFLVMFTQMRHLNFHCHRALARCSRGAVAELHGPGQVPCALQLASFSALWVI